MKEKTVKIAGREYPAGVGDYTTPNPVAKDKFGAGVTQDDPDTTKEHQIIYSRTTGKPHEISFGPIGGGLVPANPFASEAQRAYLNIHKEKLGAKGLAEWNESSKGLKLPEHVKKSK
jgi:hypothetical protein